VDSSVDQVLERSQGVQYHAAVHVVMAGYVAGVVIGLLKVDGGIPTRLLVALLWPVGAFAAVATVTVLLLAAAVLLP
jgi:hypothetical protein